MQRATLKKEMDTWHLLFAKKGYDESLIDLYFSHLQKVTDEVFLLASRVLVTTCRYFPNIAEITIAVEEVKKAQHSKPHRKSKHERCYTCLDEGVLMMWLKTDHKVTKYFLCPTQCLGSVRWLGKFEPMSQADGYMSRQDFVDKWFYNHTDNPFVIVAQRAISKLDKAKDDEDRDKINEESLKEIAALLGVKKNPLISNEKPWAYPKQFAK